jgi:sec-independent protein translocase protein TatB
MFDLGTQELIVIFIVAFLVFGPKRLPELGRALGRGIRELKAAMRNVKESFEEVETDITDELKETKTNLEDSIYKSIESDINKIEGEEGKKDTSKTDEEKNKINTEPDRDG